jgi:hypothetical protein
MCTLDGRVYDDHAMNGTAAPSHGQLGVIPLMAETSYWMTMDFHGQLMMVENMMDSGTSSRVAWHCLCGCSLWIVHICLLSGSVMWSRGSSEHGMVDEWVHLW